MADVLTPPIDAGGFSVAYSSKHKEVRLTSGDGSFSVPVEEGSEADLYLRRTLVEGGSIPSVPLDLFVPPVTVGGSGRQADINLVGDGRKASELANHRFNEYPLTIPAYKRLLYWLETNSHSELIEQMRPLNKKLKVQNSMLGDTEMKRFIELYLWGGLDLVSSELKIQENSYSFFFMIAAKNELISSDWRMDKPVDEWELCYITFFYSDMFTWHLIKVGELTRLVANHRELIARLPKVRGNTIGTQKKMRASRSKNITAFRKVVKDDSAMSWAVFWEVWKNENRTEPYAMNRFGNEVKPKTFGSFTSERDAQFDLFLSVARDTPVEMASEAIEKCERFMNVGIYDWRVIKFSIDNDIDAALIASV